MHARGTYGVCAWDRESPNMSITVWPVYNVINEVIKLLQRSDLAAQQRPFIVVGRDF